MKIALHISPQPLALSAFSTPEHTHNFLFHRHNFMLPFNEKLSTLCLHCINSENIPRWRRRRKGFLAGKEDTELRVQDEEDEEEEEEEDEGEAPPATPEDLKNIQDIKRVLDILKKNRDMLFNEVKLTVMIEDPREVERRRLLGIEDVDAPTRDDLVEALEQVNEGKIPRNRDALKMLAEEMINWPNLEVEAPKKKPSKSLYAKATDTGVNPKETAERLKIDWDSAAEIDDAVTSNESEVPPFVGYGALYLVTAFPVIIGISVVLILFYNSLQ